MPCVFNRKGPFRGRLNMYNNNFRCNFSTICILLKLLGEGGIAWLAQKCRHLQLSVVSVQSVFLINVCFSYTVLCLQRAHKQYFLECSVQFKTERMPYSLLPKVKPSGSKKVTWSDFKIKELTNITFFFYMRVSLQMFCGSSEWCGCLLFRWWRLWYGTSQIVCSLFQCGSSFWLF